MDRLSGDYIRGYSRAIMDLQEEFRNVEDDLRYHRKRMNGKFAETLLRLFLANRENFREHHDGFIRYNTQVDNLEFYKPAKGV